MEHTIDSIPPSPQSDFLIYLMLLMEEHIAALKSPCDYRDYAWGDTDQGPLAALRRYQQTSTIMKAMGWQFAGSDRAVQWAKAPVQEQFRDRMKLAYAAHSTTVTLAQKERPFDMADAGPMMTQLQSGTITPEQFKPSTCRLWPLRNDV